MISMSNSSLTSRQFCRRALEGWQEVHADKYVNSIRLKILCLLSGTPVWEGSKGITNTCEGLPWKQALGVHLW